MASEYAEIRPFNHEYNGHIYQVETFNEKGKMTSLCNMCSTLEDAVRFCKRCGIKDIRKVGC